MQCSPKPTFNRPEQKNLSHKRKNFDITQNYLFMWEALSEWIRKMGVLLIFFGTQLSVKKSILQISILFLWGRNTFNCSKSNRIGMRYIASSYLTGCFFFHFWLYISQVQNWREEEISSPLLFLGTLWSCHDKSGIWSIEKIVTLFSWKDDKKNICLISCIDLYRQSAADTSLAFRATLSGGWRNIKFSFFSIVHFSCQ